MDLNIKRWLETEAYQNQKAIIANEVNTLKKVNGYAPITNACPSRTMHIDRGVFVKDMNEKMKLFTLKKQAAKKKLVLIGRYEF